MCETDNVITATELKNNLGKYIDYAIDNHHVNITKNGKAAVRLSPYITKMDQYWMIKVYYAPFAVTLIELKDIFES